MRIVNAHVPSGEAMVNKLDRETSIGIRKGTEARRMNILVD